MEASEQNAFQGNNSPEPASEPEATPPQDEGGTTPAPDVSEQLASLSEEVAGLRTSLAGQQEQEGPLYDSLAGPEQGQYYEDPGPQPEQPMVEFDPETGQYVEMPQQGMQDPYESVIRERVAEATYPILEAIEIDRRSGQLDQLAERYPQLNERETQEAIRNRLAPMAQRYGTEMILTDPDLVERELVYLASQKTSDSEVPAAEAAAQGASLETGVGAASPESGVSPEDAIKQQILTSGGGGSAFV